jgi:hypothetical protein
VLPAALGMPCVSTLNLARCQTAARVHAIRRAVSRIDFRAFFARETEATELSPAAPFTGKKLGLQMTQTQEYPAGALCSE